MNGDGDYAPKHNPALYYSPVRPNCGVQNLSIPNTPCPTFVPGIGTGCVPVTTNNPLYTVLTDASADSLPDFAYVTPNLCNDMHDQCDPFPNGVSNGDDWLNAWIPLFVQSAEYRRGRTAVMVLWDEGAPSEPFGSDQPGAVIAPSANPTSSATGREVTAIVNNISALRAIESMMGVPLLYCAGGMQGNGDPCPAGSTAQFRVLFNI